MEIGLFFGSFNPIHIGHLIIANSILENQKLDEVWFVVSPHSPFKKKASLAPDYDRLHLVNLAIENNPRLRSSNIEFALPKPSYTSDTLIFLREKFPKHNFSLIMGSDNIKSFHKWKNAEFLAKEYPIIVYQRPEREVAPTELEQTNLNINKGPLLNISASFLRGEIKAGRSIRYMVPEPVYKYLLDSTLYK
ncbi:MAG: nicotinate (nicotinamide) nucleotide adenylyltransferase [Saprospiraceae bacterium]|nr:nicotinate (nicotinamide) nucleotide adenylyltransferase [Saprospiraceae bacterium]